MEKVYIALHSGRGVLSKLIKWQTRGKYSHASLVFEDGTVIESYPGIGVRKLPKLELGNNNFIDVFSVSVDDVTPIRDFAESQIGKKYAWSLVIRFVTREEVKRELSGTWFCSEFVFAGVEKKVALFRDTEPWEVAPELLGRSPIIQYEYTLK